MLFVFGKKCGEKLSLALEDSKVFIVVKGGGLSVGLRASDLRFRRYSFILANHSIHLRDVMFFFNIFSSPCIMYAR